MPPRLRRVGKISEGLAAHTARMPRSSADQPKSAGQVSLYWRRRVIALAAGIGMLALVAWTVNGALGGGAPRQSTDLSQTTGQHSAHGRPRFGPGHAGRHPGHQRRRPAHRRPATARTPAKHRAPAKRHPGGRGRATAAAPGACPRADLVLSLSSARYSYPAHVTPQFGVDVVSTAPGRCTANLGAHTPAHRDQGRRRQSGLGFGGLRPDGAPACHAHPGGARRGADHLEPEDLGRRLPAPAPGRPARHLHRHRPQRETGQPHHRLRAAGPRERVP